MTFEAAAYSAKGIREINEDSFIISSIINEEAKSFSQTTINGKDDKISFFAVADGMGGQGSGEKASNLLVSRLKQLREQKSLIDSQELTVAIEDIHKDIIHTNLKMGSTLTGIIFQKGQCGIVNLGDSRTYRYRNGMFLKMTNDDSLKRLDASAPSNIITNGVGGGLSSISVNCRFSEKLVMPEDVFLMCSDGVHGFVSDECIEKILSRNETVETMASTIVQSAIANNSDDNCTAVVVKIKE